MREIKFRIWDKIGREMVLNGELANGEACAISIQDGIIFSDGSDSSYKKTDMVVMQFTGLRDKNGIEVYEADICQDGNGKIGVVKVFGGTRKMPNGFGGFEQFGLYEQCSDGWQHFKTTKFNGLEVIGNIYENPELLGAE